MQENITPFPPLDLVRLLSSFAESGSLGEGKGVYQTEKQSAELFAIDQSLQSRNAKRGHDESARCRYASMGAIDRAGP